MTLAELHEKGGSGKVKIDAFPYNGEEYEIVDIDPAPVIKPRQEAKPMHKKNVFLVELVGLDDPIYLSGNHPIISPKRGKVEISSSGSGDESKGTKGSK